MESQHQVINFYREGDAYGCFSNFSKHPITLDGKTWPTSEHYFQAMKFVGTPHEEEVRCASSPSEAARLGRLRSLPLRPDWESVKDGIMEKAVTAKFTQHADIQQVLLSTGHAKLVEHTRNDRYWGDGGDGSGRNMLGITLMNVRGVLQSALGPNAVAPKTSRPGYPDANRSAWSSPPNVPSAYRQPRPSVPPFGPSSSLSAPGSAPPTASSQPRRSTAGPQLAAASFPVVRRQQPFDYFVVLDFEATCEENRRINPQEIIEFPSVLVDARTGAPVDEFQVYLRPTVRTKLSKFCTDLTGITQETVDAGVPLQDALKRYHEWLVGHGLVDGSRTFAFVTCGDWDLKTCLPNELDYFGTQAAPYFRQWINIKHVYTAAYNCKATGMDGMLRRLNMLLEGRHHSGIDDCRNIARILRRLLNDGSVLDITGRR